MEDDLAAYSDDEKRLEKAERVAKRKEVAKSKKRRDEEVRKEPRLASRPTPVVTSTSFPRPTSSGSAAATRPPGPIICYQCSEPGHVKCSTWMVQSLS